MGAQQEKCISAFGYRKTNRIPQSTPLSHTSAKQNSEKAQNLKSLTRHTARRCACTDARTGSPPAAPTSRPYDADWPSRSATSSGTKTDSVSLKDR